MEDDTGLDLSLSLPYDGRIEGKGKGSESRADKGSKLIDDFKNFLHGGNQNQDSLQRSNLVENLFYDLSSSSANVDASSYNNGRGFWGNEEETGSKRKNLFDELNHQKQHERDPHLADLLSPYIPITTDEAENEDVADSEAVGLTLTSKHTGYERKKDVNGVSGSEKGLKVAQSGNMEVQAEGCLPEHPNIRPGIGAQVKFGGSGLSPDLPWVSTTGMGPNDKTISGVTYVHNGAELRVVCACHGSHLSLDEFVQHATHTLLASYPDAKPAASAQS